MRNYLPEDEAFVMATFLRGLYYGDSWFSYVPKDIFMNNYKKIAAAIISRSTNTVKIACLKEDPSVILGYSILSADYETVHFVFVKKAWRKQGIASGLVPKTAKAVTHLTHLGRQLMPKLKDSVFNPFAL